MTIIKKVTTASKKKKPTGKPSSLVVKKKPIPVEQKVVPQEPEPLVQPPPRSLQMTRATIVGSAIVRHITQVMMNGAKFSRTTFLAHEGLMIKLRNAYDHYEKAIQLESRTACGAMMVGAENEFYSVVQAYLEQAVGHIHGTGRAEDIPELIFHLKLLVGQHSDNGEPGFEETAKYILAQSHAVVDRF